MNPVSRETVRAALSYVAADIPREEWVRMLMAVKSEFGQEGFDLVEEWSARGQTFKPSALRDTWKSIKASGGVGIGTLLQAAKANGFVDGGGQEGAPVVDVVARAVREQHEREERQQQGSRQRAAASKAQARWEAASEHGKSAYLDRKGVLAHGLRFEADGTVLVPLKDGEGYLHNVQTIAAARDVDGTDKRFLAGGRKSGLWHWCGGPDDAPVLLIAEGYATAATLHEATQRPVAVAFDCGNLVNVAKVLREKYPAARLLVCGDDDQDTLTATGKNPGQQKASTAARAVRGRFVLPDGLPKGASDFNDLAAALGIDHVREQINAALAAWDAELAAAQSPTFDQFKVDATGVWFNAHDQDGRPKPPELVCSPLAVGARTRNQDGAGWGYLLEFSDSLGTPRQWAMPARMLSGDGNEYRAALLDMGLRIEPSARARGLLTKYIQSRPPGAFAQCTDRIGWHGFSFVLPKETLGASDERIVFQSESAMENTFRARGDARQWRERIGELCAGNTRLVFAASCAFAGPMLRPAGMESGGFHFRGDSSSGKTTALKVAASVYGGASYLQRWRTTDNALEAIAAQHSDVLLILDELAQVDPRTAGECAYMLANEQSKARATRAGLPRARLSWRLLFLSAGELGLADHMAEGQKRARPGQEVRMADVPADAGAGLGAFEQLHGFLSGAAFSKHLTQEALKNHGAAGHAFIAWACQHAQDLPRKLRERMSAIGAQLAPANASGQVERVAARFAVVAAAGELATEAGLTGWSEGEATKACKACFDAWMTTRGGSGNAEVLGMLRQVRHFLELHGAGRFTWWHRAADDHSPNTLSRAGFRRMVAADGSAIKSNSDHQRQFGERMSDEMAGEVATEYFVLPEVFRGEVCSGFDYLAVCKVLAARGHLKVSDGRFDRKERLPGVGSARCYVVLPSIFADDGS